jgi:hypothetical protein
LCSSASGPLAFSGYVKGLMEDREHLQLKILEKEASRSSAQLKEHIITRKFSPDFILFGMK